MEYECVGVCDVDPGTGICRGCGRPMWEGALTAEAGPAEQMADMLAGSVLPATSVQRGNSGRMRVFLISGLSGSGKSVALRALEDAGCYCVDNLPATLLAELIRTLELDGIRDVAVAIDTRGGDSIRTVPQRLASLAEWADLEAHSIFLDARDDVLIQRFSETRRRHPLASDEITLAEAIANERLLLEGLAELGHRIDTSDLRPNVLRNFVKDIAGIPPGTGLTLMFQSFGFKHGLPLDADLVFDVRCLPNPHYDPALRAYTGRDQVIIDFLDKEPEVLKMCQDIHNFVAGWLPYYIHDNRNYLTVAIGCTGGQHRSVFITEWLGKQFRGEDKNTNTRVLVRHRALG